MRLAGRKGAKYLAALTLPRRTLGIQHLAERLKQSPCLDGFREKGCGARLVTLLARLGRDIGRQHHDRDRLLIRVRETVDLQRLDTVHLRHLDVHEDHVVGDGGEGLEHLPLVPVGRAILFGALARAPRPGRTAWFFALVHQAALLHWLFLLDPSKSIPTRALVPIQAIATVLPARYLVHALRAILLEHSIQPVQQFRYTVGKNATDSAMIIDAMDLLYTKRFEGFCLVSSDSDFTRLASRIREEGLLVYGFGEKKTPKAFVSACDKFVFTEVLRFQENTELAVKPKTANVLKRDAKLVALLRSAVEAASDESGWAHLGAVGSNIAKQTPEFDPRNYGFNKLGELAAAIKLFDVDKRVQSDGHSQTIYIREKRKKPKK